MVWTSRDTNVMDYKLKYELINDDSIVEEEYMDFPIQFILKKNL